MQQKGEIWLQQQQQQHESRFLEAPFVRMLSHAYGELKNDFEYTQKIAFSAYQLIIQKQKSDF